MRKTNYTRDWENIYEPAKAKKINIKHTDRMSSIFSCVLPCSLTYITRWNVQEIRRKAKDFSFSLSHRQTSDFFCVHFLCIESRSDGFYYATNSCGKKGKSKIVSYFQCSIINNLQRYFIFYWWMKSLKFAGEIATNEFKLRIKERFPLEVGWLMNHNNIMKIVKIKQRKHFDVLLTGIKFSSQELMTPIVSLLGDDDDVKFLHCWIAMTNVSAADITLFEVSE